MSYANDSHVNRWHTSILDALLHNHGKCKMMVHFIAKRRLEVFDPSMSTSYCGRKWIARQTWLGNRKYLPVLKPVTDVQHSYLSHHQAEGQELSDTLTWIHWTSTSRQRHKRKSTPCRLVQLIILLNVWEILLRQKILSGMCVSKLEVVIFNIVCSSGEP